MFPIPAAVKKVIDELIQKIIEFVSRHVFKSLGTTVAITITLGFCLLNPWFGSTTAKAWLIRFMVGDGPELTAIMNRFRRDENYVVSLDPGMREAGYYQFDDAGIVDRWVKDWQPKYESADIKEIKEARVAAIGIARQRARRGEPPFNPVGYPVQASRPDCFTDRPPSGTVFVDDDIMDEIAGLNPGDKVRIENSRRPNRYVIASVVGKDIGSALIWLNSSQYQAIDGKDITTLIQLVKVSSAEILSPLNIGDDANFSGCRKVN